jgi:hypothetical protein
VSIRRVTRLAAAAQRDLPLGASLRPVIPRPMTPRHKLPGLVSRPVVTAAGRTGTGKAVTGVTPPYPRGVTGTGPAANRRDLAGARSGTERPRTGIKRPRGRIASRR